MRRCQPYHESSRSVSTRKRVEFGSIRAFRPERLYSLIYMYCGEVSLQNERFLAKTIFIVCPRLAWCRSFADASGNCPCFGGPSGPGAASRWSVQLVATAVLAGGAGVLLLAGLWTPIAGLTAALVALWSACVHLRDPWIYILLATLGAALAVPTENSIALKNRDRHAIGEKFLGFAKALAAVPRFVREMPHRLLGAGAEDHGSPSLWDARIAHAACRS